jgi:thermitase
MNRWVLALVGLSIGVNATVQGEGKTDPTGDRKPAKAAIPNDPFFDRQYYFETMQVLEAWTITRGSPNVLIGVAELGFEPAHEEFQKGNVEVYPLPGMKHDPADWIVRNHGTNIVGEIIAEANNGKGIAGLAPECRVLVADIGTDAAYHKGQADSLVFKKDGEAVRYLTDRGCTVINISGIVWSSMRADVEYAVAHDVVLVVAAGNANKDHVFYPFDDLPALVVGGVDANDKRWVDEHRVRDGKIFSGSNYGKGLDVMAPCRDIVFCAYDTPREKKLLPADRWRETNFGPARLGYRHRINGGGTSAAAPMATALAALIRSVRPDLDHQSVIKIVEQGADDLAKPGWDELTGHGRINFYRSLKIAQAWPNEKPTTRAVKLMR